MAERWKQRPRSFTKGSEDRLEYDPNRKRPYSASELERIASTLLHDDPKAPRQHPFILSEGALYDRQKREVVNQNGVPDPSIVSGIYDRTHPEGRKVNTGYSRRVHGASYYR